MTRALGSSAERVAGFDSLGDLMSDYLSERHRADRANGCAVAALASDLGRQGPAVRKILTASIRTQLDRLIGLLKRGTPASRRRRAIAAYAGMVGALTLARAVDDPTLAREILAAAQEVFGKESSL